tara:strand:- start:100 stop:282 length:183 start_codon:yes stop_codon:yes gene_type:complete
MSLPAPVQGQLEDWYEEALDDALNKGHSHDMAKTLALMAVQIKAEVEHDVPVDDFVWTKD